jgi:uncharacterized protein (DUF305 family)
MLNTRLICVGAFAVITFAMSCALGGISFAQYPDVQQEEAQAQAAKGEKPVSPHAHHGATSTDVKNSPSSQAFEIAMQRMHEEMAIAYSGDADVDFVRGMIPHHRGAVEMAKVVQQYGKDPELKKLAEEIISAQEREIEFMEQWLEKNAKK